MTLYYYVIEKTVKEGETISELGEGEETWRSKPFKENRMAVQLYKSKKKANDNPYVYYHVRMEDSESAMKDASNRTEMKK